MTIHLYHHFAHRLLGGKKVSAATFQREFQLSDVLEYVKTGVASIIEDEVTQRFEGEELRSWNLLTRTNHKFRFINWKLTFFWGFGCFFRYCKKRSMGPPRRLFTAGP